MKTIWKFDVPVSDELRVEMPEGARFLSAAAAMLLWHGLAWAFRIRLAVRR